MQEKRQKHWLYAGTALLSSGALAFGLTALACSPALANPQEGQVGAGQATIYATGTTLTVEQHSDRAVIDWQSFDIAPGETTTFHQPSASSAILNRIHDQNPSQIMGISAHPPKKVHFSNTPLLQRVTPLYSRWREIRACNGNA